MKTTPGAVTILLAAALAGTVGCGHDDVDPRPPADALVDGNTGVQSKDVLAATDRMAADLLARPDLNASQVQWTIVLTGVENKTADPVISYDAFDQRLKSRLAQLGQGRVALIENKAKYHSLQNQELEGSPDAYGQGGGGGGAGVQPDYALYITIDQLPNRATDYFSISGTLTNLKTRQITWISPIYEFQSAR